MPALDVQLRQTIPLPRPPAPPKGIVELNPGDVFEYSATMPFETESVDVKAAFEDVYSPHSAISGTGRHALDVGENTIKVILVAPAFPDPAKRTWSPGST